MLDLLLWFGPRLRVKSIMEPVVQEMLDRLTQAAKPEMADFFTSANQLWHTSLEHFNLLSVLRTYPVGIPSIMVSSAPLQTPLGNANLFEMTSFGNSLNIWLGLVLAGFIIGGLYFDALARSTNSESHSLAPRLIIWQVGQTILLAFILLVLLFLLLIPTTIIISTLLIISPLFAQLVLFFASIVALWLLIPLVFSPHGIYAFRQSALRSIFLSWNLVRRYLPGTGLFILLVVVISQGMDILWRIPPDNSWLALIGIAGHAFIASGLLAASFIYYRGGMRWMVSHLQKPANNTSSN